MAETRFTTYINESIASLRTITQQLNAISVALQKLKEAKDKRQQPSSPSTPSSQAMSLPLQSLAKSVRLEFPRFRGDDPVTWVYKANQYFNFYHTPLSERLLMASFHMDGEALV